MDLFFGVNACGGISIGKAFVIPEVPDRVIPRDKITEGDKARQWHKLELAMNIVLQKTQADLEIARKAHDKAQEQILEVYTLMLTDTVSQEELHKQFQAQDFNIIALVFDRMQEEADNLLKSQNEYLGERAHDITDIFGKVIDEMLDRHPFDMDTIPEGAIIVARTLSPSDTLVLSKKKIKGLALTEGGGTSHVAILAQSYNIPSVFGVKHITKHIKTGQTLIIDADNIQVIAEPDSLNIKQYEQRIKKAQETTESLSGYTMLPAMSLDKEHFHIYANIGTVDEAIAASHAGVDGIGLFRTEFLFMSNNGASPHIFSEDKQFEAYKQVLISMQGRPVTIRTLDAGGDKFVASKDFDIIEEKNPLLGLRAIRLSLEYPRQLKVQLRALFRASIYGNLRIMLPLITSLQQVQKTKEIIEEVQKELKEEGVQYNCAPCGIMVETPSAAIATDILAKHCDFFSIGTNDLTQYTMAVDRENSRVSSMYDELNIAVLRLISYTVKQARLANISVCVCGEMASDINKFLVLAGLGIRDFSMNIRSVDIIKEALSHYTISALEDIANKHLSLE